MWPHDLDYGAGLFGILVGGPGLALVILADRLRARQTMLETFGYYACGLVGLTLMTVAALAIVGNLFGPLLWTIWQTIAV